jgi:hypothetical protein
MRLVGALPLLLVGAVLAGCGGDDNPASVDGPTELRKSLELDATLDAGGGVSVHVTGARLTESVAGIATDDPESEVWAVVAMTVTADTGSVDGTLVSNGMSVAGPISFHEPDVEEKLPDGLEQAEFERAQPKDVVQVYRVHKSGLHRKTFFFVPGGSVPLEFCPPEAKQDCVYEK